MKVIDTRSGKEMAVGQNVEYPDGESITLLEVDPGILRARARVRRVMHSLHMNEFPPTSICDEITSFIGLAATQQLERVGRFALVGDMVRRLPTVEHESTEHHPERGRRDDQPTLGACELGHSQPD